MTPRRWRKYVERGAFLRPYVFYVPETGTVSPPTITCDLARLVDPNKPGDFGQVMYGVIYRGT
jgi:hypothetical protein